MHVLLPFLSGLLIISVWTIVVWAFGYISGYQNCHKENMLKKYFDDTR